MYCSNHPQAVVRLQRIANRAFSKFCEQLSTAPESRNLGLSHFLIKPVQRICKYPLLLRELIKNTEEGHPDRRDLDEALLRIETVVAIVNEAARQTENVNRLLDLQGKLSTVGG